MLAYRPLVLALAAAFGLMSLPASAAGLGAPSQPTMVRAAQAPPVIDLRRGHEHEFHRHGAFVGLPLGAPTILAPSPANFDPVAPRPMAALEPTVIAAPPCVPPKAVEAVRARIIYVSEALAAPAREQEGVTIVYGRSGL